MSAQETARNTAETQRIQHGGDFIFPVEGTQYWTRICGPISLTLPRDLRDEIEKVPSRSVEGFTAWNSTRHRVNLAVDPFPTGAEGYGVTLPDPASIFAEIALLPVADFFDPSLKTRGMNEANAQKVLARAEARVQKFIEKLRSQQPLTEQELYSGFMLFQTLLAKYRALESRERALSWEKKAKSSEFRSKTAEYVRSANPRLDFDWNENQIVWHWTKPPQELITEKDIAFPVAHLKEYQQLIMEVLSVLGRFGDPMTRRYIQLMYPNGLIR
ncbi:hypothetical protein LRY65_02395 [Candidatus Woesebacteria bacterium]|nr:hypothetical protein [Candidatus Woesebacteria bacterium]MCD8506806.1 hypothetical protein [Candidatus Woesebacteria bacterium]MCD8527043.1 hypothetical protein [Candidatus Woesebacteria bacterium]MCD8546316.1 hypothetical protein [Candidatus Woesebacteria bacterium]